MFHGKQLILAFALSLLPLPLMASPAETDQLCQWRAKLERIYHDSRLPPKKSFEEEFPPHVIQKLVASDLHKERVLVNVYGVAITQKMLKEEIRRIEKDTKDSATLARIKTALSPDEIGFSETVAKPIVVERMLRQKFYQDKNIHAGERRHAITSRASLAAGNPVEGAKEDTWLLKERPASAPLPNTPSVPTTNNSSAPSYSNEATARIAQTLGGDASEEEDTNHYFSDLDPELAGVLKLHLLKPGDVGPIIESVAGFGIYQVTEIKANHWKVKTVFIPRKSYDVWLASQDSK